MQTLPSQISYCRIPLKTGDNNLIFSAKGNGKTETQSLNLHAAKGQTIFSGTVAYKKLNEKFTAPEVYLGKPDYKSDVYSLGKLFEFIIIDKSDMKLLLGLMINENLDERVSMAEVIDMLSDEKNDIEIVRTTKHTWRLGEKPIESGATADIYRLENQGEVSAVKIFKEQIPRELILNERDILNSINSQYVIKYKNYDTYLDHRVGINMELIDGKTLEEISKDRISFDKFCNIVKQLLDALNDIHSNNDNIIMHNDLSPKNIMYTSDNTIKF